MTTTVGAATDEMRTRMIDTLVSRIHPSDETTRALRTVPRHVFLPHVDVERVYSGGAIPTRHDEKGIAISSSSEVAIMAMMLDALRLERGLRVLEIGAGTGYNAAVLAEIAGDNIVSVDIDPDIVAEAREHLRDAGYASVRVEAGDGWLGWSDAAPYARIELTAATADISPHWVDQLEEGGLLVAPLLFRANAQAIVALRKRGRLLESTRVVAGGFMWLRGMGAPTEPTYDVGAWRVASSRPLDLARLTSLLSETPTFEVLEAANWSDVAMCGLTDDHSFTLSPKGSPAFATGVIADDGESIAVVEWGGVVLAPRMLLISFGGPAAAQRLRDRLATVRGSSWEALRVTAAPAGVDVPAGDIVFAREHYTFAVSRTA